MTSREVEKVPPGQGVTRAWPVLHIGPVPSIEPARRSLRVHGELARPLELSWDAFMELPQTRVVADFHCVTGWSRLANRWDGVLLRTIASLVRVNDAARFVRFAGARSYDTTVPIDVALGADVILARAHDDAPLAPEHGGPVRAVVPARYGWKSCKWLAEVEFLSRERLGFWEVRGYHNHADPWLEERYG